MRTRKFESYIRLHHMCHGCRLRPECEREVGECARADVAAYKHQELDPTLGGVSIVVEAESPEEPRGLLERGGCWMLTNQRFMHYLLGAVIGTLALLTVLSQLWMWAERGTP